MEKKSFGLRKWKVLLSVFHVIFLVITLAGISAMYLNGGYGKGIRWIYDETYEDSNAFCSQLGIDISNIFTYIGYKDMFETNGVLDMHKNIVRITDGPGVDENMTLDQIVRYAKIRGYYLGEDFTVQGSPMAMDDDDMEITVEYKTDNPGLADADGLETRMTKEEMALDILDRLGKYYTIYYNFISNNTNVRFRIFYMIPERKQKECRSIQKDWAIRAHCSRKKDTGCFPVFLRWTMNGKQRGRKNADSKEVWRQFGRR